jgi:glycerate kinase
MKIIVAFDSFKGTLTANDACLIAADTIRQQIDAEVIVKPMADGGEGTAEAMLAARRGKWIPKTVMGPLPNMQVRAGFAWFEPQREALVEMASASGITLLSREQLNPMKTTTFGTGQLIRAAVDYGAKKVLLAIGGSATVDGGVGAATALGWRFLDKNGKIITLGGQGLAEIHKIIKPDRLNLPPIEVLSDVNNPLYGDSGAAKIYGPQKGATPDMLEQLERNLRHLSQIVRTHFNKDINGIPGAGAAGGLGAGAVAFMNAAICSGVETIIAYSHIAEEMNDADWLVTGEGAFDKQSLMGKVISGLCHLAKKTNTKVVVIAGEVSVKGNEYSQYGIRAAIACRKDNIPLAYAMQNSKELLEQATKEFIRLLSS